MAANITIHAVIDGFIIDVEFTGTLENVRGYLDKLKAHGATPTNTHGPVASRNGSRRTEDTQDGTSPTCPVHNRAMKPGKNGGFYCSAKMQDGGYCNERRA